MSFLKKLFGKKASAKDGGPKLGAAKLEDADLTDAIDAGPEAAAATTPDGSPVKNDFSHVKSLDQAKALAASGELAPLYLHPLELGGLDAQFNIVYVPPAILTVQQDLTATLQRFASDGVIDNIQVNPEYKGDSFVPSKIHMQTTHGDKPGAFNPSIEIW